LPDYRQEGIAVDQKKAANCRWAGPTLFLSFPKWLQAWTTPWTCDREGDSRILDTTEPCASCPRWEPRASDRPDKQLPEA
jgi:hypothetical protein